MNNNEIKLENEEARKEHAELISELYADTENKIQYIIIAKNENGNGLNVSIDIGCPIESFFDFLSNLYIRLIPMLSKHMIEKIMSDREDECLNHDSEDNINKISAMLMSHMTSNVLTANNVHPLVSKAYSNLIDELYGVTVGNADFVNMITSEILNNKITNNLSSN